MACEIGFELYWMTILCVKSGCFSLRATEAQPMNVQLAQQAVPAQHPDPAIAARANIRPQRDYTE